MGGGYFPVYVSVSNRERKDKQKERYILFFFFVPFFKKKWQKASGKKWKPLYNFWPPPPRRDDGNGQMHSSILKRKRRRLFFGRGAPTFPPFPPPLPLRCSEDSVGAVVLYGQARTLHSLSKKRAMILGRW